MENYGYGNWVLVFLYIILFGLFVLTIPFKKKVGHRSANIYLAFIIALHTEMYGFPLTIYVLTWWFGYPNPLTHMSGRLLAEVVGEDLFFHFLHPFSEVMILLGVGLIIVGWWQIYSIHTQFLNALSASDRFLRLLLS